ncbi:PEP/pyruvate-binding domain-containing protein [Dolichospermum planctonicum CS-1226]|uniref:Phosphoenolpyruvate synthase n=1 Tax=Dolichospermum planctonicum CS-1226 TaxID=3021751 RepID=A0ABT5AH54_9CYAN|nr:putative PEP-binding protein [Dolichospermum planctonicum]MDB9536077.1 PEP/pyruvate-binding domain-containing protein [Dolichospermum planctonicum CS-1226]
MDKLYWLDKITLQDRAQVGVLAFYLSKIQQRGYPVLPGFVVAADVLKQFLENLNSSESLIADLPHSSLHLDVNNWRQLQQVAGRLRQEIISASVPPHWVRKILAAAKQWPGSSLILRPSLTISTNQEIKNVNGLLDSVFCPCEEAEIGAALKLLWSQLFRARSLVYWRSVGITLPQINLGVLVQPVDPCIASGVLNINPLAYDIEATWGDCLAITNGEVLPDVYYIEPETGVVLERQLGNKILAYGLDNATHLASEELQLTSNHNCLPTYLLPESQQQEYALPEEYLQELIVLGNRLVGELGTTLTVKWQLVPSCLASKLYITEVTVPQPTKPNIQFIQGIGAARGRIIANAYILNSAQKSLQVPKGVILITSVITPDYLPLLRGIAGIITEQGGLTSHGAILARELNIPAVISATGATNILQSGEKLLLDGDKGKIYRLTEEEENFPIAEMEKTMDDEKISDHQFTNLPIIATRLMVNLSQPQLIKQVQSLPVDGVGLLRSELMILNILKGKHPQEWLLAGRKKELLELLSEQIIQFARAFLPRPIFYRSLDLPAYNLTSLSADSPLSQSSILGERGVFNYMQYPGIFELELQALAIVQASGYRNINLLLPFVRTVEEFVFCRDKVAESGLIKNHQFQLWIMAEVPSILFLLPEYIKAGVMGISIGTNDLTQLLLGVDREQGKFATIFDESHPVVMKAVSQLIQMSQAGGISCSICGQAPVLYPEIIDKLIEWGITSISVEPEAVEKTYKAIARAEQKLILAAARKQLRNL